MDISSTLAPNSDQLDAVDLLAGARTFTIERVTKGDAEQPVQIHLAEFPRPWRPGKSMRRVLVAAWGPDASVYVGRRVTLFCDPGVRFGGQAVGGTRVAALSHIDRRLSVPLLVSRGKSAMYTVEPLGDTPAPAVVTATTLAALTSTFDRKGIPEDQRLSGVNHITGGTAADLTAITEGQAQQVLEALAARPDATDERTDAPEDGA